MRRVLYLLVLLLSGLTGFSAAPARAEVVVVPLEGEIGKAQFIFLRRALKEAAREKASAVIIDLDTPGGRLDVAIEMIDALHAVTVPTITYVNPNAGSAGALISLGTGKIYMAPVSAIGASAVVMAGGQDLPETMQDKTTSYYSKYFRSAAERGGYDPDLAEAFINKDKEIKRGEKTLSEKGSVLTLSAREAIMPVDGKPLLATGIADSIDDIVSREGLAGPVKRVEPAGFESLAFWITKLAPLFLIGGIVGTYLEFKAPGFGIPGALAAVCFGIYFAGHLLAGLAGYEVIGLFVLGLALVLLEVLLLPGVIILAAAGTVLMLASLLWTMVDRYPGGPVIPAAGTLLRPVLNLTGAMLISGMVIAVLAAILPQTAWFRRMTLQAVIPTASRAALESWVGQMGVSTTALRPTGTAEIEGNLVDVVTDGEFLEAGVPLRVVARERMRTLVERA